LADAEFAADLSMVMRGDAPPNTETVAFRIICHRAS
jgi:hypothetical protein